MPESAAPHTDPSPVTRPERAVPPMPSEVTNVRAVPPMPSEVTNVRVRRPAADRWLGRATMPLRKMMHRAPRHP